MQIKNNISKQAVVRYSETGNWQTIRSGVATDDTSFPDIDGNEVLEFNGDYSKVDIEVVMTGITSVTIESACENHDESGWISNNDAITITESQRLKAEDIMGHIKFTVKLTGIVGTGTVDVICRPVNS